MRRLNLFAATSALALTAFRDDPPPFDLAKALADPKAKTTLLEWAEREVASGLKAKNQELVGKLLKFKVGGTDEEPVYLDVAAATRAMDAIKALDPNGTGDVSKLIEKAVSEAVATKDRELTHAQTTISSLQKDLDSSHNGRSALMLSSALERELAKSGIKSTKQQLHENYLKGFLKITTDPVTKKEKIEVLGDDGNVRYGANGAMTLAEFIKDYSTREGNEDDWEPSSGAGGSGSEGGGIHSFTGPNGTQRVQIDPNLPATTRLQMAREAEARANGTFNQRRA